MNEERRKNGVFTGHLQTVIQVLGTAILLWVGSSLLDVRDRLIRLEVLYQAQSATSSAEILLIKERLNVLERKAPR